MKYMKIDMYVQLNEWFTIIEQIANSILMYELKSYIILKIQIYLLSVIWGDIVISIFYDKWSVRLLNCTKLSQ